MEMICPECMGSLQAATAATAKCTLHGGIYRMLFVRAVAFAPPPTPPATAPLADPTATPAAAATCGRHPDVEAPFTCGRCAKAVCKTCVFPQPNGAFLCPECASRGTLLTLPVRAPAVAVGVDCPRHAGVAAVARCANCRSAMCATCDFEFPGDLHFCPDCATNPSATLSGKRKRSVLWAYGLAVWSTVAFMGLLVAGALAQTKADAEALGLALALAVLIPSIIGVGMSVGALERRQPNPFWVWGAAVWNGVLLAAFLVLSIVGSFMR